MSVRSGKLPQQQLDCTDADKLVKDKAGNRWGFALLSLLTKLHFDCLKQIQNGGTDKFPEEQEKNLFNRIESEVESLKSSLLQLDAEHLKFIELALVDYKSLVGSNPNKQHLVEFLVSSYKAISETISGKQILEVTLTEKETRKNELLKKWKGFIERFNENEFFGVSLDNPTLGKVKEYLNVKRNADSLFKVYSAIDLCKRYCTEKGTTIVQKRLVLQAALLKVGEYLKSTSDTPNLSHHIKESLEKNQIPVNFLTKFRDDMVHNQVFRLELDGRDITSLFNDSLDPIKEIVRNEIIKMENTFIQDLIKENLSKVAVEGVRELLKSFADKGVIDLVQYIEQMKEKDGKYYYLDVESRRLLDDIYEKALPMKSRKVTPQRELPSGGELASAIPNIQVLAEKCLQKSKTKVNKKMHDELASWNIGLDQCLNDLLKIEEVVGYLQNGVPSRGAEKKAADGVLNNFLSTTDVLNTLTLIDNSGQRLPIRNHLERYFDLKSFREKLTYSEYGEIKKGNLVNVLNSVPGDSNNKKALLNFLKSNLGGGRDFIAADRYEKLVKGLLNIKPNSEEKLLSLLVDWRRKKCIDLLTQHPPAFKKIRDAITQANFIPDRVFKDLAFQYISKNEPIAKTQIRAVSLQQSFEEKVKNFYLKRVKEEIGVIGNLLHSDAMQMEFVSIYSLLHRVRDNEDDPIVIRKLRNHLAHNEQSELFGEQFVKLIGQAVTKIDIETGVTLSSFNKAVSDAQLELKLSEIQRVVSITPKTDTISRSSKGSLNSCAGKSGRGFARTARSITKCLFSKEDVEKFSKDIVDENNVDKVIIDSEKFLTYVKSSRDEEKNVQLIKFIEDKNVEGDFRYLVDNVVREQGYERYTQNERIKDLYHDISQKDVISTKNLKLKGRLLNAVGRIQLIRGVHGTIVSCVDGTATDCGLSVGGMAWSFASQAIENVIVKNAPKIIATSGQVVGRIIPGALGKQAQFAVKFAGVKVGSKIAKGVAGAVGGIFDIVDIGMSANNLVKCKKRENTDNPCGEKEIRDEIVSMSFSGVSFIAGIALAAASMPVAGVAVGFGLMVLQGVYSGISNIVEYERKYDTTHDENWSIFWRTLFFQPMARDVQHLAARSDMVNSISERAWKSLSNSPDDTVAYAIGFGVQKVVNDATQHFPSCGTILMNRTDADTTKLSRVIPKEIEKAEMICLPQITGNDYEKGITKSVPTAVHHCENAMVIADKSRMHNGKTIFYDLENVITGFIVGSDTLNNQFAIFEGEVDITGGNDVINRFCILKPSSFMGKIIGGSNATNILDLSQSTEKDYVVVEIGHIFSPGEKTSLTLIVNLSQIINIPNSTNVDVSRYHYVGRENSIDIVYCHYSYDRSINNGGRSVFLDTGGGESKYKKDIIYNCQKLAILPYTRVVGTVDNYNYTFYVKSAGYKAKDLHSEIDVKGRGTIVFPETALLDECSEIIYYSGSFVTTLSGNTLSDNTLSLKIELGQGNRYTLYIKNYMNKNSGKPNFTLIDKHGNNIVPRIEELPSPIKITSFELHAEHYLDSFDDVEDLLKKILKNNRKDYKVFSVIRGEVQIHSNMVLRQIVFGSLRDDIIHCDQTTMLAIGRNGTDAYFISDDVDSKLIIIDNNSDDRNLDAIFMTEVPDNFVMQECDLYLQHNSTSIQVKNYLKGSEYRHLTLVSTKGEIFIPYMQSMSCVGSSRKNGTFVPFFHATPTQNVFSLSKDFQGNEVVIDSRLEDIERYKDKDDLILVRENEVSFIIKVEDYYNEREKWENVNFFLWHNDNFFPYSGLHHDVDEITLYQDKLKTDYENTFKEYVVDFTQSINITHNQDDTLTSVEQDEERIGVVILKDITPGRIQVSSTGKDLVFFDKVSQHAINVKNWDVSESYRITILEFDLDLEPIIIRKLDKYRLSDVLAIQRLAKAASSAYVQNKFGCKSEIETDLHSAAANGDLGTVKCIIEEESPNINVKNPSGQTPLHSAVLGGNLELVKYLVEEKHADIHSKDSSGQTPFHLAALEGNLELVKYFIEEKNADINVRDFSGQAILHFATKGGNLELVKHIVEKKDVDYNISDFSGQTPLDVSGGAQKEDIIKYLKSKINLVKDRVDGETDVNARDQNGRTLLHKAVLEGKLDVVKYLIGKKDADISAKDGKGEKPLDLATKWKHNEIAKYLKLAQLSFNNELSHAALVLSINEVKHFIRRGADINASRSDGSTALLLAAGGGGLDIVKYLVEEKHVDTSAKDNVGNTSLHRAALGGRLDVVKYLVKEKYADVSTKDKYGSTVLHKAAVGGGLDVVKYFLEENYADVSAKDGNGWVPLHYAALGGHLDVVKYLVETKYADVSAKDNHGKRPVDLATERKHNGVVEYLNKAVRETGIIRRRRHHHEDHSLRHLLHKPGPSDLDSQPFIAVSGATRQTSWIRDLFGWVNKGADKAKGLVGEWLTDNTGFDYGSTKTILTSAFDTNATILLLDTLIRKATGQIHDRINTRDISMQEASGYAINITKGFGKTMKQAARNCKISMSPFNIDFTKVQADVTKTILSGRYSEILGVLNSYVQGVCNVSEVGKLSEEELNKFMHTIDGGLDILLNKSIPRILNGNNTNNNEIKYQQGIFKLRCPNPNVYCCYHRVTQDVNILGN